VKRPTLHSIISFLFRNLTRYTVIDGDNVPAQGPIILATNHMSRLDVPLLMIATPRPHDLVALVTDKYKANPLFSFMVRVTGSIWLDREKADFTAFRRAIEHLKQGGMLGIAPEGTRSTSRALLEAKSGAALLAEKANVPIVPVGISGTEMANTEWLRLRRPPIQIRYGKPFMLPPIDRADRETSLQCNTDEIMCRIAALLPERNRGFYTNHPRLQELLHPTIEIR